MRTNRKLDIIITVILFCSLLALFYFGHCEIDIYVLFVGIVVLIIGWLRIVKVR